MKGATRGLREGWMEGNYLRLMPGLSENMKWRKHQNVELCELLYLEDKRCAGHVTRMQKSRKFLK